MNIYPISETELACAGEIGFCRNEEGELEPCDDFTPLAAYLMGYYKGKNVTLYLMSGGGNAYVGEGLAGLIRQHGRVTVVGCGLVGSAATFMFLGGRWCYLDMAASLFIHEASNICWGTKKVFQQAAQDLAALDAKIANKYADQIELTGKLINGSREETFNRMVELMNASTTLSAEQAFDFGLCDGYYNLAGKLVKQPKEKPNPDIPTGEPASDPMPMDMSKISKEAKNQIGQAVASLVQMYEAANVKDARLYFKNFLGESLNTSNPPIQKMETPNPAAEQQNPSPIAGAETATPEQKKGFFNSLFAFLGINQPSVAEVQNQAPAPAIQPTAPIAEPTNEAPAQTPPAPVTPAPANETPIVPPTLPTPVNEIPKPLGAQDVLNEKSGKSEAKNIDLERIENPLERLKALAQFKEQCFADRSQDNHPDTVKAFEGIKDAALKA